MKTLLKIIAIALFVLIVGLIGHQDYEYESFEATHTPVIRIP